MNRSDASSARNRRRANAARRAATCSFALAGAGIAGGQVYGASDRNGGFPATDPIRAHDLTATIFHLLGIDPGGVFYDKSNRPRPAFVSCM